MLPFSHRVCPLYTLNFVIVGTRIIISSQKHNAEQKERQGKRYAAEKAGATPKRTKEQFFEKTSCPLLLLICALSEELPEATSSYSL
jgi:hypothetical protein